MTTTEMTKVMLAYERGEKIEMHARNAFDDNDWCDIDLPLWNWSDIDYRVKPKPTYRPYKNADEFLQAQKEHGMWLKMKDTDCYLNPVSITNTMVHTMVNPLCISKKNGGLYSDTYGQLFPKYVWQDGTPCGVKEE